MSDGKKGAKKSKNDRNGKKGREQIKPELVTSGLIAGLYALFLIETIWESGPIALVFSIFLFVVLVLMAYFVRNSKLEGQHQFRSLIYVFVGLAALSMIGELLQYLNILKASAAGTYWAAIVGVLNAVISIVIIAAIIYMEKDDLKKLHLRLGDTKVIGLGILSFILCIVAAFAGAYLIFGGNTMSQDKLMQIAASVIVFGILMGIVEELWFRGLLLSRIAPILGNPRVTSTRLPSSAYSRRSCSI